MTNLQLENVNPKRVDENALNKPMIDASGLLKILPQKAQAHFRMIRDKAVAVWRVRLKKKCLKSLFTSADKLGVNSVENFSLKQKSFELREVEKSIWAPSEV
jgi:hypothetical protein